jgi:Transposase DDE domain
MLTEPRASRQVNRKRKREQDKINLAEEKAQAREAIKIQNLIAAVFQQESIEDLAVKMGVIERKRELTAFALVGVLMIGCNSESVESLEILCSNLRKWFNIFIKPQTLQARINNKATSDFIKVIMTKIMQIEFDKAILKNFKKNVRNNLFNRVLVQDSTTISLDKNLWRLFRGCGGSGSKAAVKFDFIIDLSNKKIVHMKPMAGRIPDSSLSGEIDKFAGENDLILRDLGYFNLTQFKNLILSKSFFVSRLSKSVNVYLNKYDKEPIDIVKYLKENKSPNEEIDLTIYIGKIERLEVRLIGLKVPPDVIEARRQQHKRCRNKKEPSESLQEWNGCTFMITNIPREKASLKLILKLYSLRWQIELFFKACKSELKIDNITGRNKHRILCFLFFKLCIVFIAAILYAFAQGKSSREISLLKFTKWLKSNGLYELTFTCDGFNLILKAFERDKDLLYKKKTKDKPWWEENKECLKPKIA